MGLSFYEKKKKKKKLWIFLLVLIIAVLGAACWMFKVKKEERQQAAAKKRAERTVRITIPEGYTAELTAQKLEKQNVCSAEDFLKAVNDLDGYSYDWIKTIPEKAKVTYKLQGFLFPDTYEVYKNTDAKKIVGMMLDNFNSKWEQISKESKSSLTPYEIVTLASVVEREAKVDAEYAKISGVIYNRLDKKMKLQIDATVLYPLTKGKYNKKRTLYKDLEVDSPYNTYKYQGLPAGPICNPGTNALSAAVSPQKNSYLYYHTDKTGNGTHIFSETFSQHQKSLENQSK
ncbi:endolytic transglycosylase MltG [Anaerostipes sp.]|uniref:endolytic transglycosylase MltG n=1 Tax=Anaerostipes sp. TaxID=1872530 RepID=UPI0025C65FF8|nr:endolytic transglycosylase MltG [Anaerostipes sp.]